MRDHQTTPSEAEVLRDIEALAPLVNAGFARAGGPSARVLDAIRAEAAKVAEQKRKTLRLHLVFRRVAAAAVFLILLTGTFRSYLQHTRNSDSDPALTLLRISMATEDGIEYSSALAGSTDEFAQFLLTMQGLDQDSFFNSPDETELL